MRRGIIKILYRVLIAAILLMGTIFLAVVLMTSSHEAALREEQLKAVEQEALPLIARREQLRREMESKQRKLQQLQIPHVCLAVKADTIEGLRTAASWIEPFGFPISIVLDVDWPDATVESILEEVSRHDAWQVILSGHSAQWINTAETICESGNDQIIRFAYFDDAPTPEEIDLLQQHSWLGYSNSIGITDHVETAMSETALSQIAHIYLSENNYLRAVARDAVQRGLGFVLTIDMDQYGTSFSNKTLPRVLQVFSEEFISPGNMQVSTLTSYFSSYLEHIQLVAQKEAEFEAQADWYEAEINKLQTQIDLVYSALDKK